MEIISLHQEPDLAPILAYWAYLEWYQKRALDFNLVLRAFMERANNEALPQSFVALDGSLPVGMVTLKLDDLWSRKELNPWLSSLYIASGYRNRGTGHALVRAVITRAKELQYQSVHLFLGQKDTERLERYYRKRGWDVMGTAEDNDGLDTKILGFNLQ